MDGAEAGDAPDAQMIRRWGGPQKVHFDGFVRRVGNLGLGQRSRRPNCTFWRCHWWCTGLADGPWRAKVDHDLLFRSASENGPFQWQKAEGRCVASRLSGCPTAASGHVRKLTERQQPSSVLSLHDRADERRARNGDHRGRRLVCQTSPISGAVWGPKCKKRAIPRRQKARLIAPRPSVPYKTPNECIEPLRWNAVVV